MIDRETYYEQTDSGMMALEKYVIGVFILSSVAVAPPSPPNESKRYRTDYVYNSKTDAFYKLHTETKHEYKAKQYCEIEGAKLMVPASHYDIVQAHAMFKQFPDLGPYIWVAADGKSHESVEEQALIEFTTEMNSYSYEHDYGFEGTASRCDVMRRDGEVESISSCFERLPFICKVDVKDAPYDSHCDVYATGYHHYPEVGSCYKIPDKVLVWNEAYVECKAQGAHLAVINSNEEHNILKNLTRSAEPHLLSRHSWYFIIGFRAIPPSREFRTIFNQTLEEAGYNEWSYTEPNNLGGSEYCGSVFKEDGKLNDVNCIHRYAYVCEIEVNNPQ
ncbi:hypothetical protein K1T71_004126 [Dendrolimus kikuchii]|uniref:Uncharacterized protein n=1 Tax=Dendrolimus kikuchii TaxID=765133 RepID=A0ACC1DA35_9NEOP|nr:hypothetical protein K1T71_004126 [Dendrolimus kikuchii]